jgi:hypothetical protein
LPVFKPALVAGVFMEEACVVFCDLKQALRQIWRSRAGSASSPVSGVYVRLRVSWFQIGGESGRAEDQWVVHPGP